jgi:hypothetical protein
MRVGAMQKVSLDVLQVLQGENINIHWYCLKCNTSIAITFGTMNKLQLNQEKLENDVIDKHA